MRREPVERGKLREDAYLLLPGGGRVTLPQCLDQFAPCRRRHQGSHPARVACSATPVITILRQLRQRPHFGKIIYQAMRPMVVEFRIPTDVFHVEGPRSGGSR